MTLLIILLAIIIVTLAITLGHQDTRDSELTAENKLLKQRLESAETLASDTLTPVSIAEAVRQAGYEPYFNGQNVEFKVSGTRFTFDSRYLPNMILCCFLKIDPQMWDLQILQEAAHLMSDDIMIVKALIHWTENGPIINFMIASLGQSPKSLKQNLPNYITYLFDGINRTMDYYTIIR